MGGVVFLSCYLFGMGCPALEVAGCWVELGLSVETEISESSRQLILCGAGRSLVVQCPELGSPTSEVQAWHLARAPRPFLMFRLPSPIWQGASLLKAHFREETPNPTEACKTKATQQDPLTAESTFSSSFSLICCYTHSAQDNIKFLKLCFPSYEKLGTGPL